MTNIDFKAIQNTSRAAVWTEGYDGETHFANVMRAVTPALFILVAAAGLMLAIL